jgi:hypothetical protein
MRTFFLPVQKTQQRLKSFIKNYIKLNRMSSTNSIESAVCSKSERDMKSNICNGYWESFFIKRIKKLCKTRKLLETRKYMQKNKKK